MSEKCAGFEGKKTALLEERIAVEVCTHSAVETGTAWDDLLNEMFTSPLECRMKLRCLRTACRRCVRGGASWWMGLQTRTERLLWLKGALRKRRLQLKV